MLLQWQVSGSLQHSSFTKRKTAKHTYNTLLDSHNAQDIKNRMLDRIQDKRKALRTQITKKKKNETSFQNTSV